LKSTPVDRPGHYDVAILGSGFGGAILARTLCRQKKKVLLIERGRHPRFALGESSTPLASLSLERLAARYRLPDLGYLAAHGRWMQHLPHLRRGLKRGFTFFAHKRGQPYQNSPANENRLMVAASPNEWVADSHWLRRDVDDHLVRRAVEEGVDYFDRTVIEDLEVTDRGVHLVAHAEESGLHHFSADYVVDASGPGGALARKLEIASRTEPSAPTSATGRIPKSKPRSITCCKAAGSTSCLSTTESPAPASCCARTRCPAPSSRSR
jgi:tetracycline 7-halogenase / FADH2 O2-dependent halogenase